MRIQGRDKKWFTGAEDAGKTPGDESKQREPNSSGEMERQDSPQPLMTRPCADHQSGRKAEEPATVITIKCVRCKITMLSESTNYRQRFCR